MLKTSLLQKFNVASPAIRHNPTLNRQPRILRSENGKSAFRKWKISPFPWKVSFFTMRHTKSGNSTLDRIGLGHKQSISPLLSAALSSVLRLQICIELGSRLLQPPQFPKFSVFQHGSMGKFKYIFCYKIFCACCKAKIKHWYYSCISAAAGFSTNISILIRFSFLLVLTPWLGLLETRKTR